MRTQCCAALRDGQCNDCPLTAPLRPTRPAPSPNMKLPEPIRYPRGEEVTYCPCCGQRIRNP